MSHATLPDFLISSLRANTEVSAKCATRIHYQTVPQSSIYPHIYLARQGSSRERNLDGEPGTETERFVVEIVAETFDDDLCTAVRDALEFDGGQYPDFTVFMTEIEDVNDDYTFQSADSDALFLHAYVVTVYVCY